MRAWDALKLLAADQARHMRDADHVTVFLRALRALIRAGKAHLASAAGTAPASFRRWGWRARETFSVAAGAGESYDPGGECIGWVAEDDVYLDSSASYKAARQWAEQAGISLGVSRDQLSIWRPAAWSPGPTRTGPPCDGMWPASAVTA